MCKVCSGRHPTVLQGLKTQKYKKKGNNEDTDTKEDKPEEVKCALTNTRSDVISMCIVPVQIKSKDTSKTVHTYALLDSCSLGTFILNQLASDLAISGRKTSITIKTLNGEFISNLTALEGLKVASISEANKEWLPLPRTFTRADAPVDNDDITKPSQLRKWKYLENVINQLTFSDHIFVGLLIGANCTKALELIEILRSKNGRPYAFKTRLGWCVVGQNRTKRNKVSWNQIPVNQADTKEVGRHFFQVKKEMKENDLPDMPKQMYNHEFTECQHLVNKDLANMSQEDLKFIEILKNGTELVGGHYQVRLPFRKDEINLPNNRSQAEKRFACLKKRLSRNPQFKQDFVKFMDELIKKSYARESTTAVEAGKCWYLPHHAVYRPNKPGKIRVVFDLSAEFHGTSINKALLSGPDSTNQIVGVLLRFREEQIVVTGDIEAMYHQVKVPLVEGQRLQQSYY